MSAETSEEPGVDDGGAQRRESPAGVLAVAFGLVMIAGAAVALVAGRTRTLADGGAALLAESFESVGDLPFGLVPIDALALPNGDRVLRWGDPEAAAEVPADERGGGKSGRPGGPGGGGRHGGRGRRGGGSDGPGGDVPGPWHTLTEGEAGRPPVEAALVWYPFERADDVLERQFGRLRFKDFKHLDWSGERVPVDNGELDWAGYLAPFIRVRDFHRVGGEPTFTDTVRVNLTLGRRCCVLYLRWARKLPGSREGAEAFLAALRPPIG